MAADDTVEAQRSGVLTRQPHLAPAERVTVADACRRVPGSPGIVCGNFGHPIVCRSPSHAVRPTPHDNLKGMNSGPAPRSPTEFSCISIPTTAAPPPFDTVSRHRTCHDNTEDHAATAKHHARGLDLMISPARGRARLPTPEERSSPTRHETTRSNGPKPGQPSPLPASAATAVSVRTLTVRPRPRAAPCPDGS